MTQLGIELMSPRPLANTLHTRPTKKVFFSTEHKWNVFEKLNNITTWIHNNGLYYCLRDAISFTSAADYFNRVTILCDRRLTAPNITVQLNQCREKMCEHPLQGENSVKLTYMAELLSRNHSWGSKIISQASSGSICTKTGPYRREKCHLNWRIKILNLSIKSKDLCAVRELQSLYQTNRKARRRFCYSVGGHLPI